MNRYKRTLIFISVLIFVFISIGYSDENEIVIIVNKDAPQLNLSLSEIKSIYTGKTTLWSSREPIVLAVVKEETVHKAFLKKYVGRSASQFKNTWKRHFFTGQGSLPKKFNSCEDLIRYVSTDKLSIGYIRGESNSEGIIRLNN